MIRVSDLKRVGGSDNWTADGGYRMRWSVGEVRGTDGSGVFQLVGEADTAQQAKRMFCDWVNKGGAVRGEQQ